MQRLRFFMCSAHDIRGSLTCCLQYNCDVFMSSLQSGDGVVANRLQHDCVVFAYLAYAPFKLFD